MKKYIIAAILVFTLSLGGIITAGLWVNGMENEMDVSETVLYGNPNSAKDLQFYFKTSWKGLLNWTTDCRISGKAKQGLKTETTFQMKYPKQNSIDEPIYLGVTSAIDGNVTRPEGIFLSAQGLKKEIVKDVASRTKAGETRRERIRLKDYFDILPLEIEISGMLEDGSIINNWSNLKDGAAYFNISVPDDMTIDIALTKDNRDRITEYQINDNLWLEGHVSSASEKGIYMVLGQINCNTGRPGKLSRKEFVNGMDDETIAIPLGKSAGIHFIPFTRDEKQEKNLKPDWEHAKQFFAGKENADYQALSESPDGKTLFAVTAEKEKIFLTLVDKKSGMQLERFHLNNKAPFGLTPTFLYDENAVVIMMSDQTFHLLTKENDHYQLQFADTLASYTDDDYFDYPDNYTIDYTDGSLCIGVTTKTEYIDANKDHDYILANNVVIALYKQNKKIYVGKYQFGANIWPLRIELYNVKDPLTVTLPS